MRYRYYIYLFIAAILFITVSHISNTTIYSSSLGSTQGGAVLPRVDLTPGATNPAITQATINSTICNPSWSTSSIRPPSSYTTALKIKQIEQYGYQDKKTADYEEDHLISLELGGSPTSPLNLWPQPYNSPVQGGGARGKDSVENYLHSQVCRRAITLAEAQKEIVTNWYAVYLTMQKNLGSITNISSIDYDDDN